MSNDIQIRHQSILSYVKNRTTIFNTIFLLIHILFGLFFYQYNITFLYYYNFISIIIFLGGYVLLYIGKTALYSLLSNLEVYIFMILCTICLGWDYSFQQYCIIFVVSLMFTDYTINREQKLKKSTIITILIVTGTYFALSQWCYYKPFIYTLNTDSPQRIFSLVNNLITFIFCATYCYIYTQTVYRLEQTLVDVATKDTLTGLYNRRKMQDLLNAFSEVLTLSGNKLCIAMIDIDKFKRINDTYGHDAGDEVLKAIANLLLDKQSKNESFQACRWGGEEFLVFFNKNCQNNQEIIDEFEKLRQDISELTILYNENSIQFTATIGLAFYEENQTMYQLIKLADQNLYKGKTNGRNVVIYDK